MREAIPPATLLRQAVTARYMARWPGGGTRRMNLFDALTPADEAAPPKMELIVSQNRAVFGVAMIQNRGRIPQKK